MTLSGNFGLRVNLLETTGTLTTGTIMETYVASTSVGDMTIGSTDKAAALWGYAGTATYEINLTNIVSTSEVRVMRNGNVAFNNIKMIMVENQATGKNLIITAGSQSTFFAASEQMTLKPRQAYAFAYANQETVGATTCAFYVKASAASTPHSVYIIGN